MRLLRRLVLGLVLLLLVAAAGLAGALWWSLPPRGLQAHIPGLAGHVQVTLDADGIPRVAAGSETDAAAALGFLHARDRMFQMELMRRAASGRLSEIVGSATLPLDRTNRVLGLRMRAEADLPGLDPATRAALDAYARGVNAWITLRGRFAAPEFIPLGAPEPWTAVDSLLWGKTMGVWLSGNWRSELWRAALNARLSPAVQRALWPGQDVTPGPAAAFHVPTRLATIVPDFPAPFTLPHTASNEWAVDGRFTTTGSPLLAGDPHLGLGMPDIWYLARIETPSGVLVGATAPGVPFLVMGHNGRIAWTFTTTGADTQDVFVETPAADGAYQTPDGPKPFTTRTERIRIRGQPDQTLTVRETRHGPVLSDLDPAGGPILAVAMANLIPGDSAAAGLAALNHAATVAAAGQAAALITAPVQNLLVADRAGIGQFTTGRIPIRRAGDGTVPVPGADGAHDWTGMAEGDALPHQVAPASGHLLNANERTAPPGFPVFMGQDWFGDWRARRIRALLAARPKHDPASFAAMQVDVTSSFAQAILPILLAVKPTDGDSRRVLDSLRGWDGVMRADLVQPFVFNDWMRRFLDLLMQRNGLNGPPNPLSDIVAQALTPDGAVLCGGDCAPLLAQTLAETARAAPRTFWGTVHRAVFAHPILGLLPLVGELATWHIAQGGDDTTLFRGTSRSASWDVVHGPGYRGVYDLSDLDHSLFIAAPGQSGNPVSPLAASLMRRWRDGAPLVIGPAPAEVADTIGLDP